MDETVKSFKKIKRLWPFTFIKYVIIIFIIIITVLLAGDNIVAYLIIRLAVIPFILLIYLGYYAFKKLFKEWRLWQVWKQHPV
ncbi:hypothetical protein HHS34_006985 [Acidithiobacillus montserratensis]|uniref:Uncharacterized protein n=1 Tax=Acidithiobacillus montserratensis TaxID=2729135 RepID=A0ACD5HLY1_9PROT|nr:hypothetical protein [Acidithiobacillus montserratensis]MBN2679581.1 hypothetical protein [Acidithiobacillaceae bacterium]MBU2749312.1 hypothetical protein [Acidithiobacillus montserratensis]